jgi:acetyltransferase-like isoleucine patch superfamily enzyme
VHVSSIKRFILIFISLVPFNKIRIFFYRSLLNYKVDYSCKIGMFNLIDCQKFKAKRNLLIKNFNLIYAKHFICGENITIGRFNRIRYLESLILHSNSKIISNNVISGTRNYFSPFTNVFYFGIGSTSLLTTNHYIDCTGKVIIGSNVVFGGRNSGVWTHGFDTKRTMVLGDVIIGNNVYVGSNSKILQGVTICNDVSIGAGTIVSKSITESGFYVSSQLIRKASLADYSNNIQTIEYEGSKFYQR